MAHLASALRGLQCGPSHCSCLFASKLTVSPIAPSLVVHHALSMLLLPVTYVHRHCVLCTRISSQVS